ncbi:unnamed protein product [Lepeophtheirus salmonis]|uniref:(salmon louse) hypothetical protein n=1 Tax=Lepeophtheirus salmonis TaxID=72036 RepID=A0A7R8HBP6_LEPSM|nr:unnamed protein product [Lepeophtheirus salmonis]CAF2992792.1 unnamed protein product [Lepeophtheirus salmonis]
MPAFIMKRTFKCPWVKMEVSSLSTVKLMNSSLEQIQHHINSREDERSVLQDNLRKIRDRLGEIRSQRDMIGEQRTMVDDQLTDINKRVFDKREQVQKVRSGMLYQNEEIILDQIQKLEIQLTKNNFKPSEEKKIILEINRLKRSKNLLKEFNFYKSELDALRTRQKEIREKRDELFKERGEVKRVEDGLKKDSRETKEKVDNLKTEIDRMWLEKKELVNEFRALEAKHRQLLYERREEQRQKRKEDKAAFEEQKHRELEEMQANAEPYEEQRSDNPDGDSVYSTPIGVTPVTTPIEDGCFVYKKSSNDENLMSMGMSKKSSKKNKKRNSFNRTNKPFTHNPETFAQFLSLSINPPVNTNEVASTIVELKSKLKHFEEQAVIVKNSRKNGSLELIPMIDGDTLSDPLKEDTKEMKEKEKDTPRSFKK